MIRQQLILAIKYSNKKYIGLTKVVNIDGFVEYLMLKSGTVASVTKVIEQIADNEITNHACLEIDLLRIASDG